MTIFSEIRAALLSTLDQLGRGFYDSAPRLLGAFLLLVLGFFCARLLRSLIERMFARAAQLPAWGRIDPRQLARSSKLVANASAWIIFILSIAAVAELLGLRFLSLVSNGFVEHVPRITGTILILLGGYILGRLLRDLIAALAATAGAVRARLTGNFVMYTVYVVTLLIAADQTGVNVSFLSHLILVVLGVTLAGAALAFALGASHQIGNILASLTVQKLYRVGQRIRVDQSTGRILNISATGVILETTEGRLHIPARKFGECESVLLPEDSDEA
ncbi:MAG: mechanosensitive ion channel [Leptospirales bacterium]|jgi:small-conductance mechanosensitive channel